MEQDALSRRLNVTRLYTLYGPLLTEHQQRIVSLYHDHDLSLGEIADEVGVSRQAVYDTLSRAEAALTDYEARLGLSQWQARLSSQVKDISVRVSDQPELNDLVDKLARNIASAGSDRDV